MSQVAFLQGSNSEPKTKSLHKIHICDQKVQIKTKISCGIQLILVSVVELLWPTSGEFGSSRSPALKVYLFVAVAQYNITLVCASLLHHNQKKSLFGGLDPLFLKKFE